MKRTIGKWIVLGMIFGACGMGQVSAIEFNTFYIRNNGGSITPPWNPDMSIVENAAGDGFSAQTPRSGQKVGYGTSAYDGLQINQLDSVNFDKGVGSLTGSIPYLNIWVTDGTANNYAILSRDGDYRGESFSTVVGWKLFEYNKSNNINWLFKSGSGTVLSGSSLIKNDGNLVSLSAFKDSIVIASPDINYPSYVGSGAPRAGYGFNIIFGDTLANYVGAMNISKLTVTYDDNVSKAGAVPDASATLILLGLSLAGLGILSKRVKA